MNPKEKIIRDPIHGDIRLNEIEVELIDTPAMQRLRRIKQNGFCYLIYPAMNSTRFEHSLGVMYLANKVGGNLGLEDDEKEALRIAALLHDIGHCPFSHTSDDLLMKFGRTHEDVSSEIILKTEIKDILTNHGIDAEKISGLIAGKEPLSKILSSEIDIDKMDYLIRDSYYAGVAYGIIDLERIIHGIKRIGDEIVVDKNSLESVESLLIGRNMMYQTVYRHHTKRIVEIMFKRAIDNLLGEGEIGYEEYIQMDDIDLVGALRHSDGYGREIMERIDNRNLFKRIWVERLDLISEIFVEDMKKNGKEIEDKIAEDFGVDSGYLLVDIPETTMSEFMVLVEYDNELKRIDEISNLAKALEESEKERLTLCIYTAKEFIDKMKDFDAEKYIQYSQKRLREFY